MEQIWGRCTERMHGKIVIYQRMGLQRIDYSQTQAIAPPKLVLVHEPWWKESIIDNERTLNNMKKIINWL